MTKGCSSKIKYIRLLKFGSNKKCKINILLKLFNLELNNFLFILNMGIKSSLNEEYGFIISCVLSPKEMHTYILVHHKIVLKIFFE